MTPLLDDGNAGTRQGLAACWVDACPARCPGTIRDCLAPRRWVPTENAMRTHSPYPTHTHEDGGGSPVVHKGGATSPAQTTGHSRPRRILSTPAMHIGSEDKRRGTSRGGEPVPGRIRDCRAPRRAGVPLCPPPHHGHSPPDLDERRCARLPTLRLLGPRPGQPHLLVPRVYCLATPRKCRVNQTQTKNTASSE